ncbi:exodeoxyribonuclease VII large subunit [Virgibacillus profundi]|uniref:Exodeoxyribonuclease 7 large subunit n=1 Tax=Virgibacillus profundi TaxID=2024555 RepID=A0A2A2ICL6_9BACI|nr:exodeoxyribonuclease VII large subunit [Virgibacillus profundi]PAV29108.1 exodeoxyribonuclease VII large subunit [Virgibacillus profundi]PXY53277.1 exodeoxyribonuclease VII large subunit [Virgibacillus profundi]
MKDNYLTVTALTKYIKRKIDTDPHLKNIWLKGEISNFKHHSRGHMYLTIKDEQTRLQAVMFAGNNRSLKFNPENGMKVLIKGEISVFEPYGQYQLYIQQMEPDGIGALYLAFEQLKEKLHKQGLFDPIHKKKIPLYPRHIGVITSPTGAAVRDIITTIKRRYPIVTVTVIPVLVQGTNAVSSIKEAIRIANNKEIFDVLIVGRGGGSIEELWSFNEEPVAQAIFHSKVPIISAVGHETDITISDFVADLRAPTPTGAAELAVPSQLELKDKISNLKKFLIRDLDGHLVNNKKHLQRLKQSYAFRYPEQLLKQKEQELDKHVENIQKSTINHVKQQTKAYSNLNARLQAQHPKKQVEQFQKRLNQLNKQQAYYMSQVMEIKSIQLKNIIEKLTLLNPLEIMKRGFALPYTSNGEIIKSSKQVKQQDIITVNLHDGSLNCEVIQIEGDNNE